MNIELTDQQQKAVELAISNYKEEKNTVIAGYAGTGKSTIVRFLIDELLKQNPKLDYTFAAFTGKAAQVLTNKGCPATTLHKLLYDVIVDLATNKCTFRPKQTIPYDLIVVDECSMVPNDMYCLLRSYGIPLIFLGDPGQLPPIKEEQNNHLLDCPDVFLKEVLRQARDSGIIELSMKIRNHEDITGFKSKEAIVISKKDFNENFFTRADMILAATNKERKRINSVVRKLLGKKGILDENEKIMCTSNYWETDIGNSLTNGCLGNITHVIEAEWQERVRMGKKGKPLKRRDPKVYPVIKGFFSTDYGLKKDVNLDIKFLQKEESTFELKSKILNKLDTLFPKEFCYGYCTSVHKFQGSEADSIIIMEEQFPFDEETHTKWLYTAVTRAKKKLILVRK